MDLTKLSDDDLIMKLQEHCTKCGMYTQANASKYADEQVLLVMQAESALKLRLKERHILAERNANLEGLVKVIEDLEDELECERNRK